MLDFFEFSAVEDTAVLARYDIVFVRQPDALTIELQPPLYTILKFYKWKGNKNLLVPQDAEILKKRGTDWFPFWYNYGRE